MTPLPARFTCDTPIDAKINIELIVKLKALTLIFLPVQVVPVSSAALAHGSHLLEPILCSFCCLGFNFSLDHYQIIKKTKPRKYKEAALAVTS